MENENNSSVDASEKDNTSVDEKEKTTRKLLSKKFDKNASKLADAGPKTKFIGFFRLGENGNWDLHPQMLSSEDSVINKITLTHGECDIHIINVELPK